MQKMTISNMEADMNRLLKVWKVESRFALSQLLIFVFYICLLGKLNTCQAVFFGGGGDCIVYE